MAIKPKLMACVTGHGNYTCIAVNFQVSEEQHVNSIENQIIIMNVTHHAWVNPYVGKTSIPMHMHPGLILYIRPIPSTCILLDLQVHDYLYL